MELKTFRALLIGEPGMMIEVIRLLKNANFTIDAISLRRYYFRGQLNQFILAKDWPELIKICGELALNHYDLISIMDDESLRKITSSDLVKSVKEILLPINSIEKSDHIGSKIQLAKTLDKLGITAPKYKVAHNFSELMTYSNFLGFPIILKIDASSGGSVITECGNIDEVKSLRFSNSSYPILVQVKINGDELDLSGFYQNGELIYFSYSRVESVVSKFGPSYLRTYFPLRDCSGDIILELREIGRKLGIHGFANVACILSDLDQARYYFEIDLRPTLWVNYQNYLGNEPAEAIKNYFGCKGVYSLNDFLERGSSQVLVIPHRYRLKVSQILFNRHRAWRYMEYGDIEYLLMRNIYRLARQFKNSFKKFLFFFDSSKKIIDP